MFLLFCLALTTKTLKFTFSGKALYHFFQQVIDKPWLLSGFGYTVNYIIVWPFTVWPQTSRVWARQWKVIKLWYNLQYSQTETITWFICFNQCMGLFFFLQKLYFYLFSISFSTFLFLLSPAFLKKSGGTLFSAFRGAWCVVPNF